MTTLREARVRSGVSMAELAAQLGVAVSSVSTLELNDERGVAKPETVDRALAALGKQRISIVIDTISDDEMAAIRARAEATAKSVAHTMSLEAQNLRPEAIANIVDKLVMAEIASR